MQIVTDANADGISLRRHCCASYMFWIISQQQTKRKYDVLHTNSATADGEIKTLPVIMWVYVPIRDATAAAYRCTQLSEHCLQIRSNMYYFDTEIFTKRHLQLHIHVLLSVCPTRTLFSICVVM